MDEATVARLYEIRAARKALEQEEKEILSALQNLPVDDYAVGPFRVRVAPNRRFDAVLADEIVRESLTQYQRQQVTKPVVDSALLKARHPDLYIRAQKEYAPKVVVEIPKD